MAWVYYYLEVGLQASRTISIKGGHSVWLAMGLTVSFQVLVWFDGHSVQFDGCSDRDWVLLGSLVVQAHKSLDTP